MLTTDETLLLIVDIQGKLARIVHASDATIDAAGKLIRGATVLELPILWTEQNPAGLGPTVPELAALLPGEPIGKLSFSCAGEQRFVDALDEIGRNDILLAGIEAHVCVCQTALDLLAVGHRVHVVADAVSSRTPENRSIGLARIARAGGEITSVEAALFELLKVADGPKFKELLKIVK